MWINNKSESISNNLELDNNNIQDKLKPLKQEVELTKEQEEKQVLELVKVRWLRKSFEQNIFTKWISINKIKEWVFNVISNKTWNVNYFVGIDWNIIFSVFSIKERPFVSNWKAFEMAWYKEKKEDWLYNMYKVVDWKEIWPIDINSPEYYKAWLDIIFYADLMNKYVSLKFNDPETKKWIEILIEWWSFKYEDLELFLERWLITQEIFDYWVKKLREVLVDQCKDPRLIQLTWFKWESLWIKESDLRKYLEKWYIDQDLAKKCYEVLPNVMKDLSKE